MSDQPKEVEKTRLGVTLMKPYLDALDRLVTEGIYLSRGEVVLEGRVEAYVSDKNLYLEKV